MTTAGQYFHLLRWLLFPSVFLKAILALILIIGGAAIWLFISVHAKAGLAALGLALFFYSFLLLNYQARFGMLVACKTIMLTETLAWRLTVLGILLVAIWTLSVAPLVRLIEAPVALTDVIRIAILTFSMLTLLIYLGALTRLNGLLILFALVTISSASAMDSFFAGTALAWQQGSDVLYGILLLLSLALWVALYQRITQALLPRPLSEVFGRGGEQPPTPLEQSLIARLLPPRSLTSSVKAPAAILLLEAMRPMLAYFLISIASVISVGLLLIPLVYFFKEGEVSILAFTAPIVVVVPVILQTTNITWIATNVRRLWLLIPGRRVEMIKHLERTYLTACALTLLPFLLLSIGLLTVADQPLWWVACWAVLAPLLMLLGAYLQLCSISREHFMLSLVQALYSVVAIGLGTVFWFAQHALYSACLIAGILAGALLLRQLAWRRWARMDYSLLSNKVSRL